MVPRECAPGKPCPLGKPWLPGGIWAPPVFPPCNHHNTRAALLDFFKLEFVLFFVRQLIVVQPLDDPVTQLFTSVLGFGQFIAGLVQRLFNTKYVTLQLVLCRGLHLLPFSLAELTVVFSLGQTALVVLDDNVLGATGTVVLGWHLQNIVSI